MRFEGKHNYFKDLAHRVKCFKNIPKSLASRHQRLVCYQFATDSVKETLFGPGIYIHVFFCDFVSTMPMWSQGASKFVAVSIATITTLDMLH